MATTLCTSYGPTIGSRHGRDTRRRASPATFIFALCIASLAVDCIYGHACRDLLSWLLAQRKVISALKDILAGTVAGLAGLLLVYPLDTAKTRMQTCKAAPGERTALGVIWTTAKVHGAAALYRGMLSPAVGMGIIFGTQFGAYNIALAALGHDDSEGPPQLLHGMIAGFFAGVASSVPRSVFEKLKSMMQAEVVLGSPQFRNVGECAAALLKREGWLGLFTGLPLMICREGPQSLVYFPVFEATRATLLSAGLASILPSAWLLLLPGAVAGIVTWLPPFFMVDVVLSRHQTVASNLQKGILATAQQIYEEEGLERFFRGLSAALMRAAFMHSTVFCVQRSLVKCLTA